MTDNSCNKFRYLILNTNTAFFLFFLTKEILLKMIMAVHRFGIPSSASFDLDQPAFRSGCPHCSFMYEAFPRATTL